MKRRDFFNRLAGIAVAPVVAKYAVLEPKEPLKAAIDPNPTPCYLTFASAPFPIARVMSTESCGVTVYRSIFP